MKFILLVMFLAINAKAQVPCPADLPCGGTPRFMEHGNVRWSDERGVLDHLADSFRKSSNHLVYFLIYAGQNSCRDEARLRALRAKQYLVQHHKIPQADILWKDGGFRPDLSVEIWLLPKDKPLPEPANFVTIDPSKVHVKRKCKDLSLPVSFAVSADTYPNELSDYRFYSTAKWKSLRPLESTMSDVRRVLGQPTDERDVSQYTKPYPGDSAAKRPVFTYDLGNDWEVLVYFVRYCFYDGTSFPASMSDRLCSIDLVPRKRIAFGAIDFPAVFKKTRVTAVDAAWDEFKDGSGLVYEVYTTGTPYGIQRAGDLNRIAYGPSDEALARYATKSQ